MSRIYCCEQHSNNRHSGEYFFSNILNNTVKRNNENIRLHIILWSRFVYSNPDLRNLWLKFWWPQVSIIYNSLRHGQTFTETWSAFEFHRLVPTYFGMQSEIYVYIRLERCTAQGRRTSFSSHCFHHNVKKVKLKPTSLPHSSSKFNWCFY